MQTKRRTRAKTDGIDDQPSALTLESVLSYRAISERHWGLLALRRRVKTRIRALLLCKILYTSSEARLDHIGIRGSHTSEGFLCFWDAPFVDFLVVCVFWIPNWRFFCRAGFPSISSAHHPNSILSYLK